MTTTTSEPTNSYHQDVAQVVSQVAIHLHNMFGTVGTALFDNHGALVYNNNILSYTTEETLTQLAIDCLAAPVTGVTHQRTMSNFSLYAMALDSYYVFIVAGTRLDSRAINQFLANLRQIMPKARANND